MYLVRDTHPLTSTVHRAHTISDFIHFISVFGSVDFGWLFHRIKSQYGHFAGTFARRHTDAPMQRRENGVRNDEDYRMGLGEVI